MEGKLQNKIIVIIGGTAGIGLSAARACLAEAARVVTVGRDPDVAAAAQQTLGQDAFTFAGDAADPEIAPRAIRDAVERFGGFDGLYHVAGGSGRREGDGPLHQITNEGWRYTLDLNLTSIFYSNRAAAQHFVKKRTSGAILNLGSILGEFPSPKYFATHAYAAAKAGVIGLTRSAAAYYAAQNIRFNVLVPALVDTPMSERAVTDQEIIAFIKTKQPLGGGRVGETADLDAAAIFFLCDDSKFVTGQVLAVDGGWSVSEGQYELRNRS